MKITTSTVLTVAALLGTTQFASAATTASGDGSQLAVWIFLGMCALIVVVQIFPVIFVTYGLIKGLVKEKKQGANVPAEITIDK